MAVVQLVKYQALGNDYLVLDLPADLEGVVQRLPQLCDRHGVVVREPVTPERCRELGPMLERHPRFPDRTNVQLVEPLGRGRARIEIWERGAGYTLASGTSASAVTAALIRTGQAERALEVTMPGGTLSVRQEPDGRLIQTGPARRVYRAAVDLDDLR